MTAMHAEFDPDMPSTLYDPSLLTKPISSVEEKWRLLPAFLKVRGLVRQHIDSFNYLINTEMREIVHANRRVTCEEVDPNFFLYYHDIRLGVPSFDAEMCTFKTTPQECRLRDLTYSAPIIVDISYRRGRDTVQKKNLKIGHMPIMLRCSACVLSQCKSESDFIKVGECPLDPGGYFIIKGTEKVIMSQEQLSKNRIIIENDTKGFVKATVTSHSHQNKSRTSVVMKNGCFYVDHNSFNDPIPLAIMMKAMGTECDQEIVQLVGSDDFYQLELAASLAEAANLDVFTQLQALNYIGNKIKPSKGFVYGNKKSKSELAREKLVQVVVAHVPIEGHNFRPKAVYISLMTRKVIDAIKDPSTLDDKDYYGNKRLELAGQLMSLLFEDLFKKFNSDLKILVKKGLTRTNKSSVFDVTTAMSPKTITQGMVSTISSGNWNLQRFKMERAGNALHLQTNSVMF